MPSSKSNGRLFTLNVAKLVKREKTRQDLVVRKVALEALRRLVLKSPVGNPSQWKGKPPPGYVGGRFRANWNVAINSRDTTVTLGVDPSGGSTIARGASVINQAKAGDVIYLTNNVAWALPIEYGHSKQAPAGVVRTTSVELKMILRNAMQEAKSETG